ncbi:MAG: hypothetical protein L0K86_26135 [Actinomycetia bacterium]|nr:hypothetical protein [Actinomycetes bacterium]
MTSHRRGCTVAGCTREHLARGLCRAHYLRWQRTGDPDATVPVAGRGGTGSRRTVLRRVRAERGPATRRACAACGAPAWCWTAPADVHEPAQFVPSCRSCLRSTAARGGVVDSERAARLYRAGVTARGIAAVLGVGPGAVLRALRAREVPIRRGGRTPRRARTANVSAPDSPTDLDDQITEPRPRRPSPRPRDQQRPTTPDDNNASHEPTTQRPNNDDQTIAS